MHKPRVIPLILIQDGWVVQSIRFDQFLPIGRPKFAVEFFGKWDVDEIVLLDINATASERKWDLNLIELVSAHCFLPLTIGGGIQTIDDIGEILTAGADKVAINQIALKDPNFITRSAEKFGTQCIVVSIDVLKQENGGYIVFGAEQYLDPVEWAKKVESLGAGEILLQAVHRDGMKTGYDLDLIKRVGDAVSIPVIVAGGAGKPSDLLDGLKAGASAVAAGNMFQFTEHSTIYAKGYLSQQDINIRLSTPMTYKKGLFDDSGRLMKESDEKLENHFHSYLVGEDA